MGTSSRRGLLTSLALLAAASLVLAGCAETAPTGNGDSVKGQTVKIAGGITGTEADALNTTFDKFTKDTGIKVQYTGDKDFEANIVTKVNGGSAPDIAIVPQPGLLATLVGTGQVVTPDATTSSNVSKYWSKSWKTYGTVGGKFYAAPMLASVKG
ncbi:MAG: extracellular solute-binding protein, partial [Pseudolysinimonas sp.]